VQAKPTSLSETALGQRASYLSLLVGILLLAAKFWAFKVTNSQAVFSDALESIVNVATALLAIFVLIIAARPADKDHPYGHGKVEFFSAAFEGGMIAFAAVLICVEAIQVLLHPREIKQLNFGITVIVAAGIGNLLLGLYLLYVGKKSRSVTLVASGHHVLSDFWTTVGVTFGLIIVNYTHIAWLDPACALLVGLFLAWTGLKLVRQSVGGLLDAEDTEILHALVDIVSNDRPSGIIQIHHVRVMRSGRYHHIDAHAVIPEFWDVLRAHDETERFEARVMAEYPYEGELHMHIDPCRRAYCRACDVYECPIRREAFMARRKFDIDELTSPEEPPVFRHQGLDISKTEGEH
jgi:cation diffusion facilitator family transporter